MIWFYQDSANNLIMLGNRSHNLAKIRKGKSAHLVKHCFKNLQHNLPID